MCAHNLQLEYERPCWMNCNSRRNLSKTTHSPFSTIFARVVVVMASKHCLVGRVNAIAILCWSKVLTSCNCYSTVAIFSPVIWLLPIFVAYTSSALQAQYTHRLSFAQIFRCSVGFFCSFAPQYFFSLWCWLYFRFLLSLIRRSKNSFAYNGRHRHTQPEWERKIKRKKRKKNSAMLYYVGWLWED